MSNITIATPGVYDLPLPVYHSQCCDGPSVSSSGLRLLRQKTPAHFWAQSDLNPYRVLRAREPQLDFGAAAHSLLLESELPESQYAVSPFDDFRTKEAREWRDARIAEGRMIIGAKDLTTIAEMAKALAAHPLIKQGLFKGEVERSLFWKDEQFNIWLKARPDVIPHDTIAADLKTTTDASPASMARSVAEYGYHIQAALMIDGLKIVTGRTIEQYAIVAIEKEPPYVVGVHFLSDEAISYGRAEYRKALALFAECHGRGEWPGYDSADLYLPQWRRSQLEMEGLAA